MNYLDDLDVRRLCPPDLLEAINRPHEHEGLYHNRPVWIIWVQEMFRDGTVDVPRIDSVCSSVDSATTHTGAVFETRRPGSFRVFVERIPLDHRLMSANASRAKELAAEKHFYDAATT